jgi:hypothetical protein
VAGGRSPLAAFAARTDNTGEFSVQVAGGLSGYYDAVAKPAGALSRELNSVHFTRSVAETLDFGAFVEGDADGDDDVDGQDAAALAAAFGRAGGERGFDPRADFDRDGEVTLRDFSLLARSYGLAGPIRVR